MNRVSEDALFWGLYQRCCEHGDLDATRLRYCLAVDLLKRYLGVAWCETVVKPNQPTTSRGVRTQRLFLRANRTQDDDGYRRQTRLERLAELLYNLQDVPGIGGLLDLIRQGDLEATYADLEFGGHFVQSGIPIRFRDRRGTKGDDYDFDAIVGSGAVPCEVKCRLESTDLGKTTILNALKGAGKQLPSESAGIIGVKIPEQWITEPSLNDDLQGAVAELFRTSQRVAAVVVRWDKFVNLPSGGGAVYHYFRTYANQSARNLTPDSQHVVQRLQYPFSGAWTFLETIVLTFLASTCIATCDFDEGEAFTPTWEYGETEG